VHSLVRWSKETQVSAREGLAIVSGGEDSEATRVLTMIGLMKQLPVFESHDPAVRALEMGRRPRAERPLRWLTDLELAAEREAAQSHSERATRRLDEAIAAQDTRRREAGEQSDSDR
jgi:hypothetical protein